MLDLDKSMEFAIAEDLTLGTKIKVIGVGGGGSNAVARMMQSGLTGCEFHILNTDRQALIASPLANKLAIGTKITGGLGAGSDPSVGRQAALEDTERIIEILEGSDMVFVAAGLGGGTGTGAAPVVASLAKEMNALTVAVVTKPFRFEGMRRMKIAEKGLGELAETVDTVITIPNTRLLDLADDTTGYAEAFELADDVLRQAVQGITDIITTPGEINRDFADIRTIMLGMGYAMMSTAIASGQHAAIAAAQKAIANPLLEDGGVRGARAALINITSSGKLPIRDIDAACQLICEATENEDVHINYGLVRDDSMGDNVKITVIATGFRHEAMEIGQRVDLARPVPEPEQMVMIASQPEPEPQAAAVATVDPEPLPMEPPRPAPPPMPQPPMPGVMTGHDLDTPAFMRRERRLFH